MRGSGVRILFAAPKKLVKANTYVMLVFSRVDSLWPLLYPHNAWVGTANPLCGNIKISKGKHIRDARVFARYFTVATFVPGHAWVGLFDAPTLTGSMRVELAICTLHT
jgi:hypothetical protein